MERNYFYYDDMKMIAEEQLPFEKFKNKNILITGGTGLIGTYLVDTFMYLNENKLLNITLYVMCRNRDKAEERFSIYLEKENFKLLIQDVCEMINSNIKFDYVIHTACSAHPVAYSTNPVGVIKSNIQGTLNLLEHIKERPEVKFLFVSSSEVYGTEIEKGNVEESDYGIIDPLNVRSCYSESKKMAENIGVSYSYQYDIEFYIARLGHVYGATVSEDNSRADSQFLWNVLKKQPIILKSNGEQIRSYCYIVDCIIGMITILLKGKRGEAYNIGNTIENKTIAEFAEEFATQGKVDIKFEIPNLIEKKGYTLKKDSTLNSNKLKDLGWKTKYNLEKGIKQILLIKNEE